MRILAMLSLIFAICSAAAAQELQSGDTIAIAVYQDSKLDRQVVIGPTGLISVPLAGQIRAAGQTPRTPREAPICRADASSDPEVIRAAGPDRLNALSNGVVDRERINHAALVTDDARMHHLVQRITDLVGGNRSGALLLLDDEENLEVARRTSARERARRRQVGHRHVCHKAEANRCGEARVQAIQ